MNWLIDIHALGRERNKFRIRQDLRGLFLDVRNNSMHIVVKPGGVFFSFPVNFLDYRIRTIHVLSPAVRTAYRAWAVEIL